MRKLFIGMAMVGGMLLSTQTFAADFDYSGTFTFDNDLFMQEFTIGIDSDITIFTSSWDDGGFDTYLTLWDSTGAMVFEQNDGSVTGSTMSGETSYDYGVWDSYFEYAGLAAGSYTVTLSQSGNYADLVNGGYVQDGDPNYTAAGNCTVFCSSAEGDPRTSDWAFHILNVDDPLAGGIVPRDPPANVPEPASIALMGLGLIGLGAMGRRRRKA